MVTWLSCALMAVYLFKRIFSFLLMLLAASAVIFMALEVLPGNAAQTLSGPDADPQVVAALARQLGLDQPAWIRYVHWLGGLLQGELGLSYVYGSPVAELIGERLQVTLPLALMAMLLTILIALPLGVYAASRHGRTGDHVVTILAETGMAIPSFWLAILLVLLFAVKLQWFASGGFPGWSVQEGGGVAAALHALLLPAVALALVQAAILTRFTRSSMLEIMREDYVRTVRAKGASSRLTLWRHVLRNASIPILTIAGLQFANLLAGAIVTENVFSLPGLGRLIFQSIGNRDLIVIRNALLLLVMMVMVINLMVDLFCAAIDPRLQKSTGDAV